VAGGPAKRGRALRGLLLTFALSFINLFGIIFTLSAFGGLAPWSRWQFVGAFGVLEASQGIANVVSPNIWRLPVAQLQTSQRTNVSLAMSALMLPHWAALARFGAGLVLIAVAGWQQGVTPASLALIPFIVALAWLTLAISAALARIALLRPEFDVVEIVLCWGGKRRNLAPISISASVLQFLLSIATLPAAKLLPPSILYQPELAPSHVAVLAVLTVGAAFALLVYALWSRRVALTARRDQQREAEEHA
jgi:hypothetical protein